MSVVRLDFHGFVRTLRVDDPGVVAALRSQFGAAVGDVAEGDWAVDLTLDAEQLGGIRHNPQNVLHLVGALLAPRFVLLHASLVADPEGRAIAFAGPSGSGKTTSAVVAGRLGYRRLGDDLCVLDWHDGTIAAIASPVHLRPWTDELLPADGSPEPTAPPEPDAVDAGLRTLRRLVVLDAVSASLTDALVHCTFGVTPATMPDQVRRLATITQLVEVVRVEPVDWRHDSPAVARTRLFDAVREWLGATRGRPVPVDLIGVRGSVGVCDGISMQPAIRRGELVLLRDATAAAVPGPGEVVVYRTEADARTPLVMHRVIARDGDNLVTRGDNAPNIESITRDMVVFVVVKVQRGGRWTAVPGVGWWRRVAVRVAQWARRVPGLRWLVRRVRRGVQHT